MRRRLIVLSTLIAVVLLLVWTLPLDRWLDTASVWVEANPVGGRLVFVLLLIVGSVLLLPGSLLTMSGGYLFGFYAGVPLVSIGTAIGAAATGFVSREFAREWLAVRYQDDRRFVALDTALARKSLFIVILTRLSLLIPFSVLNLLYGLTRAKLSTLALGTAIGMLPAVVLYVYLGSVARNVGQLVSGELDIGTAGRALFVVGIVAAVAVTVVIHRTASQALKKELGS